MGVGAYKKINEIVTTLGCTRLFVALDAALISSEFYAEIQTLLAAAGVQTSSPTRVPIRLSGRLQHAKPTRQARCWRLAGAAQ